MKHAFRFSAWAAAALGAAVLSLLGIASSPGAPAWWADPATSIAGTTPVNDWAAANLGQLKHVATQAKAHLDFTLASIGGAGPEIDAMCQFTQQDNYAPAAVGQLKNVAKVFYDRLAQAQWNWQTGYPGTATSPYPWTGTVHVENAAPINIGQLKNAFSFDLSSWASFDQDADSMADGWEVYYGLNPGSSADAEVDWDNDGLTNRQEYNANASPLTADTDGDFSPDAEEVAEGTDPRLDTSAPIRLCYLAHTVSWYANTLPPQYSPEWFEEFGAYDSRGYFLRTGARPAAIHTQPEPLSGQANSLGLSGLIINEWTRPAEPCVFPLLPVLKSAANYAADTEGAATTAGGIFWLRGPKSAFPVTRSYVKIIRSTLPSEPPDDTFSTVSFTIPPGDFNSLRQEMMVPLSGTVPAASYSESSALYLLPVEVSALSPAVKNEEGSVIAGSELPSAGRPLTPFVELNPVADRIAHRELKVRIGEPLKGKTVTWTLDTVPAAPPAPIRGQWSHSASHGDRFEASSAYGPNGFTRLSQVSGRTTVANDGFTAVRINVPPVGFNQVRIRIQIEGMASPVDLIDMEVPGVVVIDPGHGGTASESGSSWNNATSPSGVREKDMALSYGLALRDSLRAIRVKDHVNLRVFMTRSEDRNPSGAERAAMARDNGADIIHIIHFNASEAHTARGTLEVYRTTSNVFPQQDTIVSEGIITRMVTAMAPFDSGANHRARVAYNAAVASDENNGNSAAYCPLRTAYIEVEFIDYGAQTPASGDDVVDILLNTGPNAAAVRTAVTNAMRDGILHNLRNHQPQP